MAGSLPHRGHTCQTCYVCEGSFTSSLYGAPWLFQIVHLSCTTRSFTSLSSNGLSQTPGSPGFIPNHLTCWLCSTSELSWLYWSTLQTTPPAGCAGTFNSPGSGGQSNTEISHTMACQRLREIKMVNLIVTVCAYCHSTKSIW